MNIALQRVMTVADYLAWADTQSERRRTELMNGQIVAMAPERIGHIDVKLAAAVALKLAIKHAGVMCHALGDGATVRIDEYTAYEPDALVYCGERLPRQTTLVPWPVIVVEVLSPTTVHIDTSAKLAGYFKLSSVCHYLVIDPDSGVVTHHHRTPDGVAARHLTDGMLHLDPPGIDLAIADFFA